MGFFSWLTADTWQSVSNRESSRGALKCYALLPNGDKFLEDSYGGYGVFGGKDILAVMARLNYPLLVNGNDDHDRKLMVLGDQTPPNFPVKIVSATCKASYQELPPSPVCDSQGFFYNNDREDDIPSKIKYLADGVWVSYNSAASYQWSIVEVPELASRGLKKDVVIGDKLEPGGVYTRLQIHNLLELLDILRQDLGDRSYSHAVSLIFDPIVDRLIMSKIR